jgi:hypothetical protein
MNVKAAFHSKMLSLSIALLCSFNVLNAQKFFIKVGNRSIDSIEMNAILSKYRSTFIYYIAKQSDSEKKQSESIDGILKSKIILDVLKPIIEKNKNQESLLYEYKCWPFTNYESFLEELYRENNTRVVMKQKNEIFFGPINFSAADFYDYYISNATLRLIHLLEEENFRIKFMKKESVRNRKLNNEQIVNHAIENRIKKNKLILLNNSFKL